LIKITDYRISMRRRERRAQLPAAPPYVWSTCLSPLTSCSDSGPTNYRGGRAGEISWCSQLTA